MTIDVLVRPRRARRHANRLLAVRAMAGETAWLDGAPIWHHGRVAWQTPRGILTPSAADVSTAERRLRQIAAMPYAARQAFGDADAWLDGRKRRLELAAWLRRLVAPDLLLLVRLARSPGAGASEIARLAALLAAEAVCVDGLPASPAASLVAIGPRAQPAILAMTADEEAPEAGRALAALALGAVRRRAERLVDGRGDPVAVALRAPWLQRAYAFGRDAGHPPEPGFVVRLLAAEDGLTLAARFGAAMAPSSRLKLPTRLLAEVLAARCPPAAVVALQEVAVASEPLVARMLAYRRELPAASAGKRRARAAALRLQRQQAVDALVPLVHAYARATADPDAGSLAPATLDAVGATLREGLELPATLQKSYLALLVDERARIWPAGDLRKPARPRGAEEPWRWRVLTRVKPLAALLRSSGDPEVARQALAQGCLADLASRRWGSPDLYRWALARMRALKGSYLHGRLCDALDSFGDPRRARAALQPAVDAIHGAPASARESLFEWLLDYVLDGGGASRRALREITPHIRRVSSFAATDQGKADVHCALLDAAARLHRAGVGDAATRLDWLIATVAATMPPQSRSYDDVDALDLGVQLGLALARDDVACFQQVVRTALEHRLTGEARQIRDGLRALRRLPELGGILGRLFVAQPRRCARAIVRAGLACSLGPKALAPLASVRFEADPSDVSAWPEDWRLLLATVPSLLTAAAAYVQARRLLGDDAAPPSGVRRILDQPRKLQRELAYLERVAAQQPDRADVAARLASLRARLAEPDRLRASIEQEAAERLARAAAEAQMAAMEARIKACYRMRLEEVAGPLPAGLALDDDLLNTAALSAEVDKNRQLLYRLLRAHARGEGDWPKGHPTNARFLADLRARGVDVDTWLDANPRPYRLGAVDGGRVTLSLENDPLRVLQMGNYFDTCLSLDDFNALSTVANACELNKRVVYARDGAGRVVGRQLIGINQEGGLVGFRVYSHLERDGAARLARLFARYARDLAARCHLALADRGPVPILFAQGWYDDGVVAWGCLTRPARSSARRGGHSAAERRRVARIGRAPGPSSRRAARRLRSDPATRRGDEHGGRAF